MAPNPHPPHRGTMEKLSARQRSEAKTERSARIAVTIFPLIILGAGVLALFVREPFQAISPAVNPLLGVIMFGMGLTLTPRDFTAIGKRPWPVIAGVIAQFAIMPLLGWLIAVALSLPPALAVGVILVGCCPGGTASNVVTYLARGDVALSVAMTSVSTLIAPLMTPILTLWLAGQFMAVDPLAMALSIVQIVLVPVILGLVVRLFLPKLVAKVLPALPWVSVAAIAVVVGIVVSASAQSILTAGLLVIIAVVLHNGAGLLLGYLTGLALRLPRASRTALSVEVGMQNSGLAASLAKSYFPTPETALPAAVFSVWHNISGALFAMWARLRAGRARS